MCNCNNRDFEVIYGKLYGEYDGEFHEYSENSYNFCPICGESLQPERSKREDSLDIHGICNKCRKKFDPIDHLSDICDECLYKR